MALKAGALTISWVLLDVKHCGVKMQRQQVGRGAGDSEEVVVESRGISSTPNLQRLGTILLPMNSLEICKFEWKFLYVSSLEIAVGVSSRIRDLQR